MFSFLDNIKEGVRRWSVRHAKGKHTDLWLAALAFSEASFFPIPPDVFLIAILLANKARRWFYYAFITSVFSVLGGVFGYLIGHYFFGLFGSQIISFYGLEKEFISIKNVFNEATFWAIFTAAFTPIPYKIFTITAGLFNVNFLLFITASLLGRGIRFFAISLILRRYGPRISNVLYRYFNIFSFLFVILLIIFVYVLF